MCGTRDAIAAAIGYLMCRQDTDGHWEDYDLPTGRSDAWVTAYVGLALAHAAPDQPEAGRAARRAASWLARTRPYPAGWGYNDRTGPDADSTAYALLLLRAAGLAGRDDDEEWLLSLWRPGEGFATYPGPEGWALAHPDVTPVGYCALSAASRARLRAELAQALRRSRDSDGTWPAYWWRTRHASTYMNGSLARWFGLLPARPVVLPGGDRAVESAFDLAFVTANARLAGQDVAHTDLLELLLKLQGAEGHWPGGPNLRVTRHDARDPWDAPEGELYADTAHLITTASVLRVLLRGRT